MSNNNGNKKGIDIQVANIPLECPTTTMRINSWKGCRFYPPAMLERGKLYLVVTSWQRIYIPVKGWYDVPEKGHITYISGFKAVYLSYKSIANARTWVFECFEGQPGRNIMEV